MKNTLSHSFRKPRSKTVTLAISILFAITLLSSRAEEYPIRVLKNVAQFALESPAVVLDAPNPDARILKHLKKNEVVRVSAFVEIRGIRYFMSDWSFDRWRSKRISPNWIRIGTGRITSSAAKSILTEADSRRFEQMLLAGHALPNSIEASIFLNQKVHDLYSEKKFRAALPFAIDALRINKAARGSDHSCTTLAKLHLGYIYKNLGWIEEAIPLLEDVYARAKDNNNRSRPVPFLRVAELADLYLLSGQESKAVPLYRKALSQAKNELGPIHPATKQIENKLAAIEFNRS